MKNLAAERRVLVATYKEESGTVQPVTEMTQIMDRWLEVLDNEAEAAKARLSVRTDAEERKQASD